MFRIFYLFMFNCVVYTFNVMIFLLNKLIYMCLYGYRGGGTMSDLFRCCCTVCRFSPLREWVSVVYHCLPSYMLLTLRVGLCRLPLLAICLLLTLPILPSRLLVTLLSLRIRSLCHNISLFVLFSSTGRC